MRKLWRYTGWALVFLGALHTFFFVSMGIDAISEMFAAGLLNSIGLSFERALAWYGGLWCGVMMILLGFFIQSWIRATAKAVPRYVGWTLAALGLIGTILQPGSGAPLVFLVGLIIALVRPEDTRVRGNNE